MQSDQTIGLITRHSESVYSVPMLRMIQRRAEERGYRLLVIATRPGEAVASGVAQRGVDGWLIFDDPEGIEPLVASGAPVLLISNVYGDLPRVTPDNRSGSIAAVEHLLALGRRRIAFVTYGINVDFCERQAVYAETLARHQIAPDPQLVIDVGTYNSQAVCDQMRALLAGGLRFDAAFCANDHLALGVIDALRERGMRVPEDVAVVGFDDSAAAQLATPPISSVRQDASALGWVAAELLIEQIERGLEPPEHTRIATSLVVRMSSQAAIAGDAVDAGRYASDGWQQRLVQDLVAALARAPHTELDDPRQLWPEAGVLADGLAAALAGAPAPPGCDEAWRTIADLSVGREKIAALVGLLRAAALQQLAGAPPGAIERVTSWLFDCQRASILEQLRAEQLLVELERQFLQREAAALARILSDQAGAHDLAWMEASFADWGALALCSTTVEGELQLVRLYSREGGSQPADRLLSVAEFPPLDMLSPAVRGSLAHHLTVVPIALNGRLWGYLAYAERPIISMRETIGSRVAHLAAALERQELVQTLYEQSVRDSLTGLYNRRFLTEQCAQHFAQARRYGHPLSLASIDIDHFKRVNDTLLHSGGDRVLVLVAAILRESVRAADIVARIGGEEFVVLLPETSLPDALAICERLRAAIEGYRWDTISPGLGVTVSIGVADDGGCAAPESLLARSDACLYLAKAHGRNRVVGSAPS